MSWSGVSARKFLFGSEEESSATRTAKIGSGRRSWDASRFCKKVSAVQRLLLDELGSMARVCTESVMGSIIKTPGSVSRCNSNCSEDSSDPNLTLEDLDVIKTIGAGSFGRVVLVQDSTTGEYGALKILSLFDLIRLNQVDHVKNEKNVLRKISNPFVINLKWHFKDEYNIYMLFEYICGGELFSYLRKAGTFSSSTSSFYAAEIVCTLEYLHSKSIVYRDLKPENLLLDRQGHLKMTDFGFAKEIKDRTFTICGTVQYLSPEVLLNEGQTTAVDWWALGVLIFEMMAGYAPFYDDANLSKYEKILKATVDWEAITDPLAKDIVRKLLTVDTSQRLGNLKNGAQDVKDHIWFEDFDWTDVYQKKLRAPIIPKVLSDGDTNNFDDYPDSWSMRRVSDNEQDLFSDF